MYKKLYGYYDLPRNVAKQIDSVVNVFRTNLGNQLVGVYLHGSIVLNAFHHKTGDIDILVVVEAAMDVCTKLSIAKDIIAIDGKPRPLEISAITLNEARHWKTPGQCVFHYSDYWTEQYKARLEDDSVALYVVDYEFPDADVTSYIKLLKQSGITLYGKEIAETFADVSDEDFWDAISAEIDDYDFHDYQPRYFASNILILGRILSFKIEKKILSKFDGGLWMIEHVPKELQYLPKRAMDIWFNDEEGELPEEELKKLKDYLISEIKK